MTIDPEKGNSQYVRDLKSGAIKSPPSKADTAFGYMVVLALVALLGWCTFRGDGPKGEFATKVTEQGKFDVAHTAVKARLRDGESAEFRNDQIGKAAGSEIVCGEVNSRNGFGGMTGFQRYVSNGGVATVLEEQMSPADFAQVWAGC